MKIVRNIIAVVVGYLIFAVSAVMLFNLAGIDPHAESSITTKASVIAFGMIFSFLGGYVTKMIAASRNLSSNIVLAVIIAGFAVFSALKSGGEHYTQIAAILLFAPASIAGGIARRRTTRS